MGDYWSERASHLVWHVRWAKVRKGKPATYAEALEVLEDRDELDRLAEESGVGRYYEPGTAQGAAVRAEARQALREKLGTATA